MKAAFFITLACVYIYSAAADLDDQVNFNSTTISLTTDLLSFNATINDQVFEGGFTLVDDVSYNIFPPKLTIKADLAHGRLTGVYNVSGELNLESGNHSIQGDGQLDASITNVQLTATANLRVSIFTNKVTIVNLNTQRLAFDSVDLTKFTGTFFDGEPVDWEVVSKDSKKIFDKFYAEHKTKILESVKAELNKMLADYNLTELWRLIKT